MNSSAKITFSFLAAAALGAAIFTGCSVTSGTVNDTDGGVTPTGDSGGGGGDTGTTTGDTGTGTTACGAGLKNRLSDLPACETCLDDKCCAAQKTCVGVVADKDAGKLDCDDYQECTADCQAKATAEEIDACQKECDKPDTTDKAIIDAYDAIESCGRANCGTACQFPDAG